MLGLYDVGDENERLREFFDNLAVRWKMIWKCDCQNGARESYFEIGPNLISYITSSEGNGRRG